MEGTKNLNGGICEAVLVMVRLRLHSSWFVLLHELSGW